MSEFTSNSNNLQQTDALKVQDDRVTELLANPEIRQGQQAAEAAIAEYYQGLEASGKYVKSLVKGVTAEGDCIDVVEVSDVQKPSGVKTGGQSKQDYDTQFSEYYRTKYYCAFTYHLEGVVGPDFAQSLSPRIAADVREMLGGDHLYFAQPGQDPDLTFKSVGELREEIDKEAYVNLRREHHEQLKRMDEVALSFDSKPATFNNRPVMTLEDATLGKRRQAIVDKTLAPLVVERERRLEEWIRRRGDDPEIANKEYALMQELNRSIEAIKKVMRANPDLVDNPSELILDPILAEQMAYKANMVNTLKARGRKLLRLFGVNR